MKKDKEERPKIGVGYQVGDLIVESPTEERKNGYMIWSCRCSCGNTIRLDTRCLQRGTVKDCGCKTKLKPGTRDITGMRFGKLVAIEPAKEQKPGNVIWHCKCDCGGEVDAPLHQLTAGYRKSCGCLSRPPLENLVDQKFHMLTVTSYAGKRKNGAHDAHYWNCICDCGNTAVVRQDFLKSGKTKSCGCLAEKVIQKNLKLIDGTSVTVLQSVQNKLRSNNTSGYTGVYQDTKTHLWHARIVFKRKVYDLGTYKLRKDAIKARMRGEEMHEGFLEWYYSTYREGDEKGGTPGAKNS